MSNKEQTECCDRCEYFYNIRYLNSVGNELFCHDCYDEICKIYEKVESDD